MRLADYFRRGQHRVRGPHSITVADLTATLDEELNRKHPTGFHLSADGKYLVFHGQVHIPSPPDDLSSLVLMVEPPAGLINLPALDDTVDLTVLHKDSPREPEATVVETGDGKYRLSLAIREGAQEPVL